MSAIGDRTKFTFTVVVALLGLSAWLTTIYVQGTANANEISDIKARLERIEALEVDMAAVKAEVHEINKKVDRLEQ